MKQRTKHAIQFVGVIVIWCFMIVLFMWQMGEAAEKAKVIVVPEKSKEIMIISEDNTHILVDLETNETRICVSDDGTVIICTD